MYADIIVLTYQSPDIDYFTYLIPKNLEKEIKVGQLVEIPFGKRNPTGLVLGIRRQIQGKKSAIRNLKKISKIIFNRPILLTYQIELLKWMGFYYLAPLLNCLERIIPQLPKRLAQLDQFPKTHSLTAKATKPLANQELATKKVKKEPALAQTLILVPTINRIAQTLAQFKKARNYAVYHNELKQTEKFETWLKIISGKVEFVFGSRSAIFTPCPNLSQIIIFDEHDATYKDERSPYFDTLTIAEKISALTESKIKVIDTAPKIQTYFSHAPNISIPNFKVKPHIISMQNERMMQNYSPISKPLLYLLEKNVKTDKNSLLFLNKTKESGSLFCKNCKTSLYLEKQPQVCPNCQSPDIYFNVLNIRALTAEVKKLIPNSKVNLISELPSYGANQLPSYPTIDISTASIFYAPVVMKYDLVTHIQPDALINRADFSSNETLYEQVANLKNLVKENGLLVLQTLNPDNSVLKAAAMGNYPTYFSEQLKLRRALYYPPFALLIKLTIRGKNKQKIHEKAQKTVNYLKAKYRSNQTEQSKINNLQLTILGPYESIFWQKIPSYHIILKYKLGSYLLDEREAAIRKLTPIIKEIRKDYQIVVEPQSIN